MRNIIHAAAFYSVYFAPRGRERLLFLGEQISQRHLSFDDRLIGIIGDAGSGKSSLIKGMFPGIELVNDDDGLNSHQLKQAMNLGSLLKQWQKNRKQQTQSVVLQEAPCFISAMKAAFPQPGTWPSPSPPRIWQPGRFTSSAFIIL